jgi:hypothetical protein
MHTSLEELKRLIRKIELNKTEPELLVKLIDDARSVGEGERRRLGQIAKKSFSLFKTLKKDGFLHVVNLDRKLVDTLKKIPLGSVDGSFQVTGGKGGLWYVIIGVSKIVAKNGFTLSPDIKVDGIVEPIKALDEADARRKAGRIMMLSEIKAIRKIGNDLQEGNKSTLLIDGPIIDPPLLLEKEYVTERVDALKYCNESGVSVIGFVKRIMGRNFLNYLSKSIEKNMLNGYVSDFDLLNGILFNAVNEEKGKPVFTRPIAFDEGMKSKRDPLNKVYQSYKEKGLCIYCSYYRSGLRGGLYRIELASFHEMKENILLSTYEKIMSLISEVWTLAGTTQPLPIIIAHNKCNVRKGAADSLYNEIISRMAAIDELISKASLISE